MRFTLTFAFLLTFGAAACAAPIIFTYQGTGSGTIASTAFTNVPFTIVAQADTSNRVTFAPISGEVGYSITHASAQISLGALGTYSFTSPTRTYAVPFFQGVGFSRSENVPDLGTDLYQGPGNDVFSSWDMLSSIGPITGVGELLQWNLTPTITTSGGVLKFANKYPVNGAIFTAILVPEPSTILLAAVAVAALPARRRKSVPHNRV